MKEIIQPLIMVFYIENDSFNDKEFIKQYSDIVSNTIENKNILVFFLPTTKESRIECINPVVMAEPDMAKVTQMIEDIKEQFSIAAEMDALNEEITPDDSPCECGGNCKCNQ